MNQLDTSAFSGVIFPEVAEKLIINISANETPIFSTLLSLGRKSVAMATTLEWWTVDADTRRTLINEAAGYLSTDTDLTLDAVSHMRVGDVLAVERTSELMLITAIVGLVVTVVRSVGTTAAAALVDNDPILNLGPFAYEGKTGSDARNTTNAKKTSYTQIFERTLELTRSLEKSSAKGEDVLMQERRKKLIEISRDIEYAALFGEPFEETSAGKRRRGTMGVRSFATVNVADGNGTVTEPELDDWLSQIFTKGSQHRLLCCGRTAADVIRRIKKPSMQGRPEDSVAGFRAERFATPDGEFDLVRHKLMVGTYDTEALAIDLQGGADGEGPTVRFLKDSDLALKENVQDADTDGRKDKYLGELGFTWGNPEAHGRLTNIAVSG